MVLQDLDTPKKMARMVQADEPDLSSTTARASIIGYIYGVSPGLAIPIVFGLTKPFRNTIYATFVPKRWQKQGQDNLESPSNTGDGGGQSSTLTYLDQEYTQDLELQIPDPLAGSPTCPNKNPVGQGWPRDLYENAYELAPASIRLENSRISNANSIVVRPGSLSSMASRDVLLR